jgi:uncharacterized RDD family membrane protein YckC
VSDYGRPPAGWYADPHNGWQYRYWDGRSWTEHIAPAGGAAAGGVKVVPPLPFPAVRAEFGRRFLGYIIDVLVITVPTIILLGLAIFLFVAVGVASISSSDSSSGDNSAVSLVFVFGVLGLEALLVVAPLVYNGFFMAGGRRTVGQRVAGLRVVDAGTGGPITLGRSLVRVLVAGFASSQLLGLGYWWALWDGERRTWHDMASSSVVIDERT